MSPLVPQVVLDTRAKDSRQGNVPALTSSDFSPQTPTLELHRAVRQAMGGIGVGSSGGAMLI